MPLPMATIATIMGEQRPSPQQVADEKKFSRVTAKSLEKVDAEHVPEELKCPITKRLFEDPVHAPPAPPHTTTHNHHLHHHTSHLLPPGHVHAAPQVVLPCCGTSVSLF